MSKKRKDGSADSKLHRFLKSQFSEEQEKAQKNIHEYSFRQSDKKNGGKRTSLKLELEQTVAAIKEVEASMHKANEELRNTDRHYRKRSQDEHWAKVIFSAANAPDVAAMLLYFLLAMICLGAGFSTAFTSLRESGISAFDDHPLMAACIAMLLPVGGMCIKTVKFSTDAGRKRYAQILTAMALTSLAVWIGYFAHNFSAMSGDVSEDSFSSNPTGPIFTILQCLTELLCGSVMALKGQTIFDILFGYLNHVNPKHEALVREIAGLKPHLAELLAKKTSLSMEISVLEAEYELDAEDLIADFKLLKDQFHFTHSSDGE